MKLLVIGRDGQLARGIVENAARFGVQVIAAGRPDTDVTDRNSLEATVAREHFDAVVNAAAYTAVDKAESEPSVAHAVNAIGADHVARACAANSIPIIHIIDSMGAQMKADGITSAALVGTSNVMAEPWYRQRLVSHGINLAPNDAKLSAEMDRIIYDELMFGRVNKASERELKTMLTRYDQQDIDAVVLGCTELVMLVDTKANVLPVYDSTEWHAKAGVDWIMGDAP